MNFSCVVNLDRENLTPFIWTTEQLHENGTIENGYSCATAALLILFLGVPLNLFITVTILWKNLYKSVAVIPMLNLAICYFLVCLFILPLVIISGYSAEFIFGSSDYDRCKVCYLGIANVALPSVSVYTIALMSVGRLLYIKKPLQYHSIVTLRRMVAILAVIWTFSMIVSLLPLFGFGSITFSYVVVTCVPVVIGSSHILPNWYYSLLIITVGTVAIVVLFVMYIWIVCIARQYILRNPRRFVLLYKQSAAEINTLSSDTKSDKTVEKIVHHANKQQQFRLIQVLVIVLANVITWLPMIVLAVAGAVVHSHSILYFYLHFLPITNNTASTSPNNTHP